MGRKKIKLTVVESPSPQAATIAPTGPGPAFSGDEPYSLVCGKCETVLVRGLSEEFCRERFITPVQMLIKCFKCGAHNRVPAKVGN